jgi:dihydrodipicolinate synthase/N-acetylneuraminate lyase
MVSAGIKGVHCVLFALWDSSERLDRGAMRAQVDWALEHGAEGIVVLGLATEVGKLALSEKLEAIDWAAQDVKGLPLTVTVAANSVPEQKMILRAAEHAGAALAILQPPLAGTFAAAEYIDFIARVGEDAHLPLAVQNAPQYLGRSLSGPDLAALKARLPHLGQVKAEMPAVDLAAFAETCGSLTLLNGRGGLEMTDALRIGCRGFIVAPDVLPGVAACWRAWEAGNTAEADVAYAAFLPAATFGMQSLEHLVCYGKRIWGRRAAVPIHDRAPALRPSEAGLRLAERWAAFGTDVVDQDRKTNVPR